MMDMFSISIQAMIGKQFVVVDNGSSSIETGSKDETRLLLPAEVRRASRCTVTRLI
jgi:hypothetical protein